MEPDQPNPSHQSVPTNPQKSAPQQPSINETTSSNKTSNSPPKPRKGIGLGLSLFALLSLLFFSPFLPGKSLPISTSTSGSLSSGQSISCSGEGGPVHTTTHYSSKKGFPLTYSYSATSSIEMECNGSMQSATGGQSGEFNAFAAVTDLVTAALLAFILIKVIRKFAK